MTAEAKTSPKRPSRRLGINDPEVLAMFNELAEMKYLQYLAEEETEKKALAEAQGDAKAKNNTDEVFGLHRIKTWQLLSKS
jgi:hypothetical protein